MPACRWISVGAVAALPLFALIGCAETPMRWENANLSEDAWEQDKRSCRRWALNEAEEEYVADQRAGPNLNYSPSQPWQTSMAQYGARDREDQLFESCLRSRGYVQVEEKEQE